MNRIIYGAAAMPEAGTDYVPVDLTAAAMARRRGKVLAAARAMDLDVLIVYADREHGSNFAYLTGFAPRFEEALLFLFPDGRTVMCLGNENLKMAARSLLPVDKVVHVPHFSLPCQPMDTRQSLAELLAGTGVREGMRAGLAGWKYFTSAHEDDGALFDVPSFIVDALRRIICGGGSGALVPAGGIFLAPDRGVRTVYGADEIAHFEFGAGLASSRVLAAMNAAVPGMTELELADVLTCHGQTPTVTTICAAGERFTNAVIAPRGKALVRGETLSLTLGLEGGLTSRAGYIAESREDLPGNVRDYVERVAIPYYRAYTAWLEAVRCGASAGDIYALVEEVLPKKTYGWTLNPGHFTDRDEWSTSPFFAGSGITLRSGMVFQLDIIPSVPGYGGVNAEDGLALGDESLREELAAGYPQVWARIRRRQAYIREELGIRISDDVLPMSDTLGYLRPLILDHGRALRVI